MARRSRTADPEVLRAGAIQLLESFKAQIDAGTLRDQVRALVLVNQIVRDLGSSLVPTQAASSGKGRVLWYLREHPGQVISTAELMIVAGIGDYPRRIRELRKEEGWPILSGYTARDMRAAAEEEGFAESDGLPPPMRPDDYLLLEDVQDHDAAARWAVANAIRRRKEGVQSKVLAYFRANVGKPVTSEELRYVANDKSEWARRTRELRTEEGWPITTRFNGNPKLPVGVYVLAEDRQAPVHDRHIKEITRREVMKRDKWQCQWRGCGWSKDQYAQDPRFLEAHHIEHHAAGGSNDADNLVTLCNLHHDAVHAGQALTLTDQAAALLKA